MELTWKLCLVFMGFYVTLLFTSLGWRHYVVFVFLLFFCFVGWLVGWLWTHASHSHEH